MRQPRGSFCLALLFVSVLEILLNNHSVNATFHFLGDRHMRACIKSYKFDLELIDNMVSALILPCLDYKAKSALPRNETRPRLKNPRPRQDQHNDTRDQDQGQGTYTNFLEAVSRQDTASRLNISLSKSNDCEHQLQVLNYQYCVLWHQTTKISSDWYCYF